MWFLLKLIFGVRHHEPNVLDLKVCEGGLRRLRWRLKCALVDIRAGIYNEYPLCCVLHFVYDGLACGRNLHTGKPSALIRGGIRVPHKNKQWAACGWHSGRHPYWVDRSEEYYLYLGRHRKKARA